MMKTGLILGMGLLVTIGLWTQIGWLTLVVLPVMLIFAAAAFTPVLVASELEQQSAPQMPTMQPQTAVSLATN